MPVVGIVTYTRSRPEESSLHLLVSIQCRRTCRLEKWPGPSSKKGMPHRVTPKLILHRRAFTSPMLLILAGANADLIDASGSLLRKSKQSLYIMFDQVGVNPAILHISREF